MSEPTADLPKAQNSVDLLSRATIYRPLRRPTALEKYTPGLRVIDLRESGPRVIKTHNIPFVGLITEPSLKKGLTRLGVTAGYLILALAVGVSSSLSPRPTQQDIAKAMSEPPKSSFVERNNEKIAFLEEFLFEGFTKDEMITASQKIAIFMGEPATLKDTVRNFAQNVQGITSSDLRPMNKEVLDAKIAAVLLETMPDASNTQREVRAKLLKAIFEEESNHRSGVVNTAEDATGLGQVTPSSFKEVIRRFKQNSPEIYQKYFSAIKLNLDNNQIENDERKIIIETLKNPDINILVSDELLKHYSELHSSLSMGLMAYGSNPNDLTEAESVYAKLVGKVNPERVDRDFKGVDENDNFDPNKPPATKTYTEFFKLNPIKLMHEAVTGALKSSGHFMGINWNYPWIIAARALGNDPDEFPAMAEMIEVARADQTKVQSL